MRDEMEGHEEQAASLLQPLLLAALSELARLAQQADADRLLERLLSFCAAQQGALLLITGEQRPAEDGLLPFPRHQKAYRVLALHTVQEEDALQLLATSSPEGAMVQIPREEATWVVYRFPISLPPASFKTISTASGSPTAQEQEAVVWFLAGWTEPNRAPLLEKGMTLLPLLADAVRAAIVNLLLAERAATLDMAVARSPLHEAEHLFSAELLATVSHELRTPLASIKGYTAMLLRHERRLSRAERHDFLLAIEQASQRLSRRIEDLLELSQLETGMLALKRAPVDVGHVLHEAITVAEQRTDEHTPGLFTFRVHLKDSSGTLATRGPLILADPYRLREVLDHLLENAVTYSPQGGVIDVILRPILPGNTGPGQAPPATTRAPTESIHPLLEICVCDYGLGIPPEHLGRIFERFYRLDTRLTRDTNGLGLGLTLSKYLIELHEGRIWAESCPAGGSAFHILLPMDQPQERLPA